MLYRDSIKRRLRVPCLVVMTKRTAGESTFEEFCSSCSVSFKRVKEGSQPTPDYKISLSGMSVFVEIKQIDKDENFESAVKSRTVGSHVRAKINEARDQMKTACAEKTPAVLLIYNNLDPLQMFGTEPHDFVSAMYGEHTVVLTKGRITDSFHGRNKSLREGKNESFSAVGAMYRRREGIRVEIYENVFARYPLDYSRLPASIYATRVELTS